MANDERAERLTESGRIRNASDIDNEPEPDDPEHRGDFAEGIATTHTPPGALPGDFAAGQENPPRTGTVQPRGDFATGQEEQPDDSEHRGDFAEGTATTSTPPGVLMGDFAAGQENPPRTGTVQPRGDFATGQEEQPVDPTAKRGDFAKGLGDESRKDDARK
jgi:hypothetical protein